MIHESDEAINKIEKYASICYKACFCYLIIYPFQYKLGTVLISGGTTVSHLYSPAKMSLFLTNEGIKVLDPISTYLPYI